jgi:hypothetical protein
LSCSVCTVGLLCNHNRHCLRVSPSLFFC